MDNMRGLVIRGAFAMAPVSEIVFQRNDDIIQRTDDFNGSWDDLSPKTQKSWEKLATILELIIESEMWKQTNKPTTEQPCVCITHKEERYHHPQCTSFHTVQAVGYVGGKPNKPQLFQGQWPHGTIVNTYDDRCPECKEFDNDGCPSCGPNTIKKVFDPAETPIDCSDENCPDYLTKDDWYKNTERLNIENLGPCPYEDKLCPECKQELKPCPSGWSCANGHGF